MHNHTIQLQSAHRDLQNNEPQAALATLQGLQQKLPDDVDVAHLLALTYKALGNKDQSEQQFRHSLAINQQQPEVHNNLANLLKANSDYAGAEKHYRTALKLFPEYVQGWRNLAICLQAQEAYAAAIDAFAKASELAPQDPSPILGMADSYRSMGELEHAHDLYQKAISLDPNNVNGWHNLGLTFHLQGQLTNALNGYRAAYKLASGRPEIAQSYALCLHEIGRAREAIELFKAALQAQPESIELHERFNGMLWESPFSDDFGHSYRSAIKQYPNNIELVVSYASLLFSAGQPQSALQALTPHAAKNDARILALQGKISADLGDLETAHEVLSASLKLQFDKDVAHQLIKIALMQSRYSVAQNLLDRAYETAPNCQLIWALQSLVWRLTGDSRYDWLMKYDELIQVYQLEPPNGYASLEAFLSDLVTTLTPLHNTEKEPLLQTLRKGTQTAPRLLHRPDQAIKSLKAALQEIVQRYIAQLPDDPEHPMLARKSSDFEFSGSWSVKLRPDGFHVNHVHTDGWISSSCYISIPDSMQEFASEDIMVASSEASNPLFEAQGEASLLTPPYNSERHPGCIKFGESPLQLGDREVIEKCVRPTPGMVVLFPSYCWHGTFPFQGAQSDYRMTAPFDILPLK